MTQIPINYHFSMNNSLKFGRHNTQTIVRLYKEICNKYRIKNLQINILSTYCEKSCLLNKKLML